MPQRIQTQERRLLRLGVGADQAVRGAQLERQPQQAAHQDGLRAATQRWLSACGRLCAQQAGDKATRRAGVAAARQERAFCELPDGSAA